MNKKKIFEIIKKSLKIKKNISLKTKSNDLIEWDSLGHLAILSAIDKYFKNKTSKLSKLADADSVSKICKVLKDEKLIK